LYTSAYKNTDGSYVIVALNVANSGAITSDYLTPGSTATPYVTNGTNSMTQGSALTISGGKFTYTVPAQTLVTFKITF
jgi:O-glycosyl hydrolase